MESLKDYVCMRVTGNPWKDQEPETVDNKYADIEVGLRGAKKLDDLAKAKMREVAIKEMAKAGKGTDSPDLGGLR